MTSVDIKTLRTGPIRYQTLPDSLVKRIYDVHALFVGINPTSLDQFLEAFTRDAHPERELFVWEAMVRVYRRYQAREELPAAGFKELFDILVVGSVVPSEDALNHISLILFSPQDARNVPRLLRSEFQR